MAWSCSASTNAGLVANLKKAGIFRSEAVEAALLATDRAKYSPGSFYEDSPQYLGHDATISAPHMHCMCLELLLGQLRPGSRVLDVGCGSGYLTATFSRMVGETGLVVGLDHLPELVELSRRNLTSDGVALNGDGHSGSGVTLMERDGWAGAPEHGLYDAIHVGAAAATVPSSLLEQLKEGGRMIIPVGPNGGDQSLLQIDKSVEGDGRCTTTVVSGVRYVPLVRHDT